MAGGNVTGVDLTRGDVIGVDVTEERCGWSEMWLGEM